MITEHLCHTPCGDVQGTACETPGVTAFRGIRYATAGRWEYPQPVTHWDGVYQADHFGPNAMQQSAFVPEDQSGRPPFYFHEFREGLPFTYSEDCLFLNVWAPDNAEKAPVIVYIHGGAFMSGAGWDKVFEEPRWVRHGVVSVTINYRLGVLGYACLPALAEEAGHTGNYGLYDQMCALQWVKDNIAAFGGDPENITVMGQSAGARSVQALISTQATRHLIHRAVMSSGGGDDTALFAGDWHVENKYAFWQSWQEATGAEDLAALRALPVQALFAAFGKAIAQQGFEAVMANMGPVWDNASFPADSQPLQIPYMAGANTEDMRPDMIADALRWCQKQPVPSYAWCFGRQLPGDDKGAWHSADLWYWFGTLERCWRPFAEEDRALSDAMVTYLVQFARTGDPNGAGLPVWTPSAPGKADVMHLNAPAPAMGPAGQGAAPVVTGW